MFAGGELCSTRYGVEVGPFHLLPGYPVGISGRTLPVQRVRSDLNTRGYLHPAGNDATGTRVPGYPPVLRTPGSIIYNISRKLIQMSTKHENPVSYGG